MAGPADLLASLPVPQRLALAYTPAAPRARLAAILALDARLAGIVRHSREPMLAQLRLAWWREQLGAGEDRPRGDPLLDALAPWRGTEAQLVALIDAWEGMVGDAPLPPGAFMALADARAACMATIADAPPRICAEATRAARAWALADIAAGLSDPAERESALQLAAANRWRPRGLGRDFRALAVLHRLAHFAGRPTIFSLLAAVRIGLFGR